MPDSNSDRLDGKMPIYLDYQATTPTDERVVAAMLPWFNEKFGNPHSSDHRHGWVSEEAVERARGQVASIIGAKPKEIVFTSGATEANNLSIKGVAHAADPSRRHIVTLATEHKCVLQSCKRLEEEGFDLTILGVRSDGLVDLDELARSLTDTTLLVSVMAVNNEIGVIQPLAEIGALCRERGIYFHTDAAQAVGKIPLDVNAMKVDLMSITAHKFYGPKGVGALYIRRRPKVALRAEMDGGGQERGLRSGTVPTPLVVGFGEACAIAEREMPTEAARLADLRDRILSRLREALPTLHVHGDLDRRIPGNLNLSFANIDGQDLMMRLDGLSVSTGSACSSAIVEPSHVLQALDPDPALLHNSLRIGLGRYTTPEEIDRAADDIVAAVSSLQSANQVYEKA